MSRINSNIASMRAIHRLARNNDDLATRLQRLSTGLRINTGKDAPAALIASENLRSEMSGIGQAIDNSQRATNVINTAEGALSEVSALLLEMQSLAIEAANNGGLSREEIAANQLQVDAILSSINRIANTTQFNGIKLLNGSLDYTTSGVASSAIDVLTINASKLPEIGGVTIAVEVLASAQLGGISFTGATVGTSAVTIEIAGNDGAEQLSFTAATTISAVATAVNQLVTTTGVSATIDAGTITFNTTNYGSRHFVNLRTIHGSFTNGRAAGVDAAVNINGNRAEVDGITAMIRNSHLDVEIQLDPAFAQQAGADTDFLITGGGARFQVGSTVNRQGQVHVGIGSVSTFKLGNRVVGFLSQLGTGGEASLVGGRTLDAQRILDIAIRQVATLRGRLGAVQKDALETNVNSLSVALENVTASESAIRDADFASETAAMTRAQILVQATTSVLSQANASPRNVLALLQ